MREDTWIGGYSQESEEVAEDTGKDEHRDTENTEGHGEELKNMDGKSKN